MSGRAPSGGRLADLGTLVLVAEVADAVDVPVVREARDLLQRTLPERVTVL